MELSFFNEDGTRAEPSDGAPTAYEHVTETTDYKLRYILAEACGAVRATSSGATRDAQGVACARGDERRRFVKVHAARAPAAARGFDPRADFFARMYGVTLDAVLKRFDVRTCHTEVTENVRLECDPAPSPPPPNDWVSQKSHRTSHAHTRTLTFPAPLAGCAALAARDGLRDRDARSGERLVGALLHRRRGLLPGRGRPHDVRAPQLAHARHARVPRGRDALRARGGAPPRRAGDGPVRNDPAFRGRALAQTSARAPGLSGGQMPAFTLSSLIGSSSAQASSPCAPAEAPQSTRMFGVCCRVFGRLGAR